MLASVDHPRPLLPPRSGCQGPCHFFGRQCRGASPSGPRHAEGPREVSMPEEGDDPPAEQAELAQGVEVKDMTGDQEKEEGGSDPVENEAEELISPKTSACSKNCSLGRMVKGLVTIGVIALLFVFQNEVSKQIASARDDIKKLPAVPVVLITLVVNTLRFCFPPLYYTVPYTALFAFWSADTLGIYIGAFAYQAIKIPYMLWFAAIRYMYKGIMGRILDGDPKAAPCCLRGDFLNALSNFDKNWGARFKTKEKKPTLKENVTRAMMIVSMGCTLAWDDLLTVFFLATRTPVSQPLYCCAVSMSICCEYMKTTIKLKTYLLILDAAVAISSEEEGAGIWKSLEIYVSGPWYEILCIVLFVLTATAYVHGSNALFCVRACTGKKSGGLRSDRDTPEEPAAEMVEQSPSPREEREEGPSA